MNTAKELYDRWLAQPELDTAVAEELHGIAGDDAAITDRFYRDLEFGTGGLRGVLGAGTNRMNLYTVRKATQGLADYLNATDLPKKIAIAHDSRNNGELFTREAARVLAANGITACVYPRLEPTPALSWAVRYLGCGAGVCITASHNPAKYNGYKVYGADGCQITLEVADKILAAIEKVDCFDGVKLVDYEAGVQAGRIVSIDDKCLDDFVQAVYDQRVGDGTGIEQLKLVYTPLNGTGLECVKKLLAKLGVTHVTVVPEQETPDGNFPTCPYPNPEIREAMQKDMRGDEDGRVYSVAYKIYDIQARHHYMPVYERRYDVFAGCFEEVQTGCEDSIEVINVTDIDGRIWPGHMARLKNYAKRNNL